MGSGSRHVRNDGELNMSPGFIVWANDLVIFVLVLNR